MPKKNSNNTKDNNSTFDPGVITFPLTDDGRRILNEELAKLVQQAYNALAEAQKFADTYKLSFHWDVAYGMGGYYYGDPEERDESEEGWYPSSQSC